MDNTAILLFILNGLMVVVMYFMKMAHDNTKNRLDKTETKLDKLSDEAHRKSDFQDFKNELWRKLDDMKADFQRALDKN